MEGKRFIHRLKLKNLLSFGPEGIDLELEPLNVLIGPNASGKSNFIEAISLLQATPDDLAMPFREGGGIEEWLWKGVEPPSQAELEALAHLRQADVSVVHCLALREARHRVEIADERLGGEALPDGKGYYAWDNGQPQLLKPWRLSLGVSGGPPKDVKMWDEWASAGPLDPGQSVLAQVRDQRAYPELTELGQLYTAIRLYREWTLGRFAEPRKPQRADLPGDFLLPDGSNLALIWSYLEHVSATERITEELRRFYPPVRKVTPLVLGGTIQLMLHEEGLKQPIPAARWSDGTLRYLCLLTILCHPEPPPLVCLEEPELGLHPDIIPRVAELLLEASSRMQLIVTTHSDALVSGLTSTAESVVVCERKPEGTQLRRLEPEGLRKWLDEYTLGDLWAMGEIGGTLK